MKDKIAVIGLGYVGYPLAKRLATKYTVIGYDKSEERIEKLQLKNQTIHFSTNDMCLEEANIYIIAVPTPINPTDKTPNLSFLLQASKEVGAHLHKNDLVIYESTVFPGTTEKICIPILLQQSGLKKEEIYVGYSPERINPGDRKHNLVRTTKLISSNSYRGLKKIKSIYNYLTNNNTYTCNSIKEAEAAKLLENVQRDVNIALMNEFSVLCSALNISFNNILNAAQTKWNFSSYYPGLVGGHCIGVDPYYLIEGAKKINVDMDLPTKAREVNENMVALIIDKVNHWLTLNSLDHVLVLGCTFKPNIDDIRNSKPLYIAEQLTRLYDYKVSIFDPFLTKNKINVLNDLSTLPALIDDNDAILLLSPHQILLNQLEKTYSKSSWLNATNNKFVIDPYGCLNKLFKTDFHKNYYSLI